MEFNLVVGIALKAVVEMVIVFEYLKIRRRSGKYQSFLLDDPLEWVQVVTIPLEAGDFELEILVWVALEVPIGGFDVIVE